MNVNKQIKNIVKQVLHFVVKYLFFLGDRIPLTIKSGPAKGIKIGIDIRDNYQYYIGKYDSWFLRHLDFSKYIQDGYVCWDCGSYIGYYTAIFRNYVGSKGQVHTFEASPKNYQIVQNLPKLNNWNNVHCYNYAVGENSSEIKFTNNIGGANGPFNYSKQYQDTDKLEIVEVKCFGTDELVDKLNVPLPDFIKFDLESAEEFALMNGNKVFTEKRPVVLMESHTKAAYQTTIEFGEKYNYSLYNLNQHPANDLIEYDYKSDLKRNQFWIMFLCIPKEFKK